MQHAVDLRHQRLLLRHSARVFQAPFSSVAGTLSYLGLGHLRNLESKPPVQRYEWERHGDLIHGTGSDATRLVYVEVPQDEQKPGDRLLQPGHCLVQPPGHRVPSSEEQQEPRLHFLGIRQAYRALGLRHSRTRPYTPRTNGKAEPFIQTRCKEWA